MSRHLQSRSPAASQAMVFHRIAHWRGLYSIQYYLSSIYAGCIPCQSSCWGLNVLRLRQWRSPAPPPVYLQEWLIQGSTSQIIKEANSLAVLHVTYFTSLLVQRCKGITAGLGYLEVYVICPCKSPHLPIGRLTSVRTVDLHWGEWLNSSADFNPNHNLVNAAPTQASLWPLHVQTTMQLPCKNYCI
jgi:hypothetical protein